MTASNLFLPSLVSLPYLNEMCELAAQTPTGAFVEVGVYHGGSAQRLYEVAAKQDRTLHLFDTFQGIPFQGLWDKHEVGEMNGGLEALERIVLLMPKAKVYVGTFPETFVARSRDLLDNRPSFVHADADQYQSTKDICEILYPLLVPGGMILFDDYRGEKTAGCTKAVDEYCEQHGLKVWYSPKRRVHLVKEKT